MSDGACLHLFFNKLSYIVDLAGGSFQNRMDTVPGR